MANPCIFPTLRYADADGAIRWLTETLGFREHAIYRADDGTVAHAELALGVSIIMLGQARDDAYGAMIGSGKRTDAIYIAVADADAAFARVQSSGAMVEKPPHDTDHGSREFACRDPEGNLWSVGTYWPNAADQI